MADSPIAVATRDRAADGPTGPCVAFDHVSLAFDEKVILKDVSFTLPAGHTKIILGASGAGKSMTLKILLGLLKAGRGRRSGSTGSASIS